MNLTTLLKLASTRLDAERGGTSTSNLAYAEVDADGNLVSVNPLARMKWGWQQGHHVQGEMQIALEGLAGTQPTELPLKLGGLHIGAIVRGENGGWQVFGYDPDREYVPERLVIDSGHYTKRNGSDPSDPDEAAASSNGVHPRPIESANRNFVFDGEHDGMDQKAKSTTEDLQAALNTLRMLATTSPDHAVFCDSAMQTIASAIGMKRVVLFIKNSPESLSLSAQSYVSSKSGSAVASIDSDHPIFDLVDTSGSAKVVNTLIAPSLCRQLDCESGLLAAVKENGYTIGFVGACSDTNRVEEIGEKTINSFNRLISCFESLYSWITLISRYRDLLSTLEEAVFTCQVHKDGSRIYRSFSDKIDQLSGYRPLELTGSEDRAISWIDEIVVESDRESVRQRSLGIIEGDPTVIEYRITHRNGSIRWIRERAWTTTNTLGMNTVLGTMTDISEQKAVEVMATDAQENVDATNRSKTAFVATISHEVRTPVGALNGYAQLLQKELVEFEQTSGTVLPDQVHEFVNVLTNRSHKLQMLVHDLFELSNLEMGRVTLQHEEVAVNELIEQCASKESPRLQRKGIALVLSLSDRNPSVMADSLCLTQVVGNVLSNATKFTEKGSVSIRTRVDSSNVVIEVEDTGIGISEEYRSSLFEPYSQEENWRTRKFGGTGLGLALSRRILENFGGRIDVESEKGKGSTFKIVLPLIGDH